jgi:transposase
LRERRQRRGGLTKTGNVLARRALIEAAWTYRMPARSSRALHDRIEAQPKAVRDTAWTAQVRLCARYRRLLASGKAKVGAVAAIARALVGFLWAIARQVQIGSAPVSDQHGAQGWRRGTLGEPSC